MRVVTVRERKDGERRTGLTPEGVVALVAAGHEVLIEAGSGAGAGFSDEAYIQAGARVVADAADAWGAADLMVKVKEPVPSEYAYLSEGCALFTYLHLATDRPLTERLIAARVPSLAYELVRSDDGRLPLLRPMSQVAGRMAGEVGAQLLKQPGPGRGMLLGGVAGVAPGRCFVVGSGSVGVAAARVLLGLGARVTMLARDLSRLAVVEREFGGTLATRVATPSALAEEAAGADLGVLGILVPGARAPKVLSRATVRSMGEGAVLVDVSIDQGGAAETSRPTTHSNPTYVEEGVVHYCVSNMPGTVPRTSTTALASATLPYVMEIAAKGVAGALRASPALVPALSTWEGAIVRGPVADAFGLAAAANPFTR